MKRTIFIASLLLLFSSRIFAQSYLFETDSATDYRYKHLVQTGAYAMKIVESSSIGSLPEGEKSYDSIYFRVEGDSVIVVRFYLFKGKYPKLSEKIVYSKDWKRKNDCTYPIRYASEERVSNYDRRGNILSEYNHNANFGMSIADSLLLSDLFTYDAAGNRISYAHYDEQANVQRKWMYSYTPSGFLKSMIRFERSDETNIPDSMDEFEALRFKAVNKSLEELKMSGRTSYEIDSAKRTVTSSIYSGMDSLTEKSVDAFDSNWRLTTRTGFSPEGELEFSALYKYDDKGREIYSSSHYERKLRIADEEKESEYDSLGHLKLERTSSNGEVSEESSYTYDSEGHAVEKRSLRHIGTEAKEDHESTTYDQKGNIVGTIRGIFGMDHIINYKIYYKQ